MRMDESGADLVDGTKPRPELSLMSCDALCDGTERWPHQVDSVLIWGERADTFFGN